MENLIKRNSLFPILEFNSYWEEPEYKECYVAILTFFHGDADFETKETVVFKTLPEISQFYYLCNKLKVANPRNQNWLEVFDKVILQNTNWIFYSDDGGHYYSLESGEEDDLTIMFSELGFWPSDKTYTDVQADLRKIEVFYYDLNGRKVAKC